jgi:hypothetical protein
LIRNADKKLDAARAELDARWDALLEWWEQEYLEAVEAYDRIPTGVPAKPQYASLRAYLDERVGVAHRPRIKRVVDLIGYRVHGAGAYGQPIFGSASVPDGWSVARGFGK